MQEKCVCCTQAFPVYYHTEMLDGRAWCSGTTGWVKTRPSPAQLAICFCYVHLEMVECSMFGGITEAAVVQNKQPLLLLAQTYSMLCVHVSRCVDVLLYSIRGQVVYLFYGCVEWLAVVMMHRFLIVNYVKKNGCFRMFSLLFLSFPPSLRAEVIAGGVRSWAGAQT